MVLNLIKKINSKSKFVYKTNKFSILVMAQKSLYCPDPITFWL